MDTAGLNMGSNDKYHSHYNELRPVRGIHEFFLYPWNEKLTRVRAHQRLVSCHEKIRDVRKVYKNCLVYTFDGPVHCPL